MRYSGLMRWSLNFGLFLLSVQTLAQAADAPDVIVYATNPHYPPYDWSVSDKAFAGASIELLELVKPPGVVLKPSVLPWKRAQAYAEQGLVDLLVSIRITPERSEYLSFTAHRAFPNPIAVFARKDRSFPFKTWADLKPLMGGWSTGDYFGGGFDEYWRRELKMEEAPSMENNFGKLGLGRIDYFVTGYYVGMAYIKTHPDMLSITALTPLISSQDIHFAFSKRSKQIHHLKYMSQRLEELDKQDVPEALLKKHLELYIQNPGPL